MPLLFRRSPSVALRTEPLHPDGPGGGDGAPAVAGPGAAAVLAGWPLPAVVAAKSALNLAFAGQYGWQRVGFPEGKASGFCSGYTVLGRIEMPTANQERGLPIASCALDSSLAAEWPQILRATGS